MRTLPIVPAQAPPNRHTREASERRWAVLRLGSVAAGLGLGLVAVWAPSLSLLLFWGVFVPLAPLVFLIAPGLWRNICPMATLNGLPSRLGWSRGWRVPGRAQRAAPAFSACLFLAVVPLRKVVLDQNGIALAGFVLLLLALAFASGLLYGGKGGWCSQLCPMGPVERLYGHSPLLVIRDTHCRPCVGCVRHCYDLNPTHAHLAELYSGDRSLRLARLLFAGAMPWLCIAFFTQPTLIQPSVGALVTLYGRMSLLVAIGAGLSLLLSFCPGLSHQQVIRVHTIAALNLYCVFALPMAWPQQAHIVLQIVGVALPSGLWLWAATRRECVFVAHRFLVRVRRRAPVPDRAGA